MSCANINPERRELLHSKVRVRILFWKGVEEDTGGGVQGKGAGFGEGEPAVFFGFVVEEDVGGVLGNAGVVEEDEVGVAIELGGVDAILGEDKLDPVDLEIGFFFYFAAEGSFGGFAEFGFAAGDAPKVRPFMGANHQDLAGGIEDERADGGDGMGVDVGSGVGGFFGGVEGGFVEFGGGG